MSVIIDIHDRIYDTGFLFYVVADGLDALIGEENESKIPELCPKSGLFFFPTSTTISSSTSLSIIIIQTLKSIMSSPSGAPDDSDRRADGDSEVSARRGASSPPLVRTWLLAIAAKATAVEDEHYAMLIRSLCNALQTQANSIIKLDPEEYVDGYTGDDDGEGMDIDDDDAMDID